MSKKYKYTNQIISILKDLYPDAKPALQYSTPYELLIAVVLSAQCTDARVNKVTSELFKKYNTPEQMVTLTVQELEKYIYSCGFYHNKAEHILSASRDIIERFNGEVPSTIEELMSLAGVGRKTANVVYSVAFEGDVIAVDTHVFRVSNRTGIAEGKTPLEVEKGLNVAIEKKDLRFAHHWLIYHGRQVCHSQKPNCEGCKLKEFCKYYLSKE